MDQQARKGGAPKSGEDILVFWVRRETECAECGKVLWSGSAIRLEESGPRCLTCADLDHLVFLPRGDVALTRRASRHSRLRAVVVQWSRTRRRYERQGILVEESALAQAEKECLSDAEQREARRRREAQYRERRDQRYVETFARAIRDRYPGCPLGEELEIAGHACERYSGRVGRSATRIIVHTPMSLTAYIEQSVPSRLWEGTDGSGVVGGTLTIPLEASNGLCCHVFCLEVLDKTPNLQER